MFARKASVSFGAKRMSNNQSFNRVKDLVVSQVDNSSNQINEEKFWGVKMGDFNIQEDTDEDLESPVKLSRIDDSNSFSAGKFKNA